MPARRASALVLFFLLLPSRALRGGEIRSALAGAWRLRARVDGRDVACTLWLAPNGELWPTLVFLAENHAAIVDNVLISVTSATGQLFIYYTIKTFGPVVFTIIMTTRQMVRHLPETSLAPPPPPPPLATSLQRSNCCGSLPPSLASAVVSSHHLPALSPTTLPYPILSYPLHQISMVISTILFGHALTLGSCFGAMLVFGAVFYRINRKRLEKRARSAR